MSGVMSGRCTVESRSLINRGNADIRGRLDIGKLDQCSETSLGLITVGILTVLIWVFCLPFFDVAGMDWVKGWESLRPSTPGPPIAMWDFKSRMFGKYPSAAEAFIAMDHDQDGLVDFTEFVAGVKTYDPPLDEKQAQYAFNLFDTKQESVKDHLLESTEFSAGLNYMEFAHIQSNETSTTTTVTGTTTLVTTTIAPSTTTRSTSLRATPKNVAVVSMAEFKSRLPEAQRSSARTSFVLLDTDGDEFVDGPEFVQSSKQLTPPLDEFQAKEAFNRLDTNNDGRIESLEFFMAFEADMFLRPADTNSELLTVKEYRARMGSTTLDAHVKTEIASKDFSDLFDGIKVDISRSIVSDLAALTGIQADQVSDMDGKASSATASKDGKDRVKVEAMFQMPHDETTDDILAVLESRPTSHFVAVNLKKVLPDYKLTDDDVKVTAVVQPTGAFAQTDTNKDNRLSQKEFHHAGEMFTPPLTSLEAAFAFKGLDLNGDFFLSPDEYMGVGVTSLVAVPRTTTTGMPTTTMPQTTSTAAPTSTAAQTTTSAPAMTTTAGSTQVAVPITMKEFVTRMGAAFHSTEDAFIACDTNSDKGITFTEFGECASHFQPALTTNMSDYVSTGMDADHDGSVSSVEFFNVIRTGKFFPTSEELKQAAGEQLTMEEFKKRLEASDQAARGTRLLEDAATSDFLKLDSNGDQHLTKEEFMKDCDKFHPPLTAQEAHYAFKWLDSNHDGQVTVSEFTNEFEAGRFHVHGNGKPYVTMGELKTAFGADSKGKANIFELLDSDKNGFSDHSEFVEGALKVGLSAEQGSYTFHALDSDRDDKVSPEEVSKALSGSASDDEPLPSAAAAYLAPARSAMMAGDVPLSLSDFKARLGTASPQDAFLKLDGNDDGFLEAVDFTSPAAQSLLSPALTADEADYVFKGLDVNKDAAVCVSEFFGTLRLGDFYQTEGTLQAIGAIIKTKPIQAPSNGAGLAAPITEREYLARIAVESAEDVFSGMDENKDGMVSSDEYYRLSSNLFSPPLTPKEAVYSFKGIDADNDDFITPTEYFGILKLGHFFQTPQALKKAESQVFPNEPEPEPTTTQPPAAASTRAPTEAATTAATTPAPTATSTSTSTAVPVWHAPITLEDFIEHMRSSHASPQGAFKALDFDVTSRVSFHDFAVGVKDFKKPLTDTQAMYAFKGFDSNEDHIVSENEFLAVLSLGHFFQTPQAVEAATKLRHHEHKYDCDSGESDWEFGWSDEKKAWCCKHDKHFKENCDEEGPKEQVTTITLETFVKRMGKSMHDSVDMFNLLDVNKDGLVTTKELQGQKDSFKPALTEDEVETVFSGLDGNLDGRASLAEFSSALQAGKFYGSPSGQDGKKSGPQLTVWHETQKQMTLGVFKQRLGSSFQSHAEAFDTMDSTKDKFLSHEEFVSGVQAFKTPLAKDEAEYAFTGFDLNGDDRLDDTEFEGVLAVGRFYPNTAELDKAGVDVKPTPTPALNSRPASTSTTAPTTAALVAWATSTMVAEPTTTTTEVPWETMPSPITLKQFTARMGPTVPAAISVLSTPSGGCVDLTAFRAAGEAFTPPMTQEEADYAFCGMDENHDKKVCSFEFFGIIKIGQFFPSRAHLEQLKEVGVLKERPAEPEDQVDKVDELFPEVLPGTPVSVGDLQKYLGVPAMVNGRAEITLHLVRDAASPGEEEQLAIGDAFEGALEKELQLDVEVEGISALQADYATGHAIGFNPRDRTIEIMWTAGAVQDGGALDVLMRQHSLQIETSIKDAIDAKGFSWLERSTVWVKTTLNYYGPQASQMPDGQKISKDIGHKPGEQSEDTAPAYVTSSE